MAENEPTVTITVEVPLNFQGGVRIGDQPAVRVEPGTKRTFLLNKDEENFRIMRAPIERAIETEGSGTTEDKAATTLSGTSSGIPQADVKAKLQGSETTQAPPIRKPLI